MIFTTRLPRRSTEIGKDAEVAELMRSVFPAGEPVDVGFVRNAANGLACFIPRPDGPSLREALAATGIDFDVDYPLRPDLQYIHKVVDGRDVYYFANLGGAAVETEVSLRGRLRLEEWDPHTGEVRRRPADFSSGQASGAGVTKVKLDLMPYRSCFWVGKNKD